MKGEHLEIAGTVGMVLRGKRKKKNPARFFNIPNHDYCVAETGYLADKAGPSAPDREFSMLGS